MSCTCPPYTKEQFIATMKKMYPDSDQLDDVDASYASFMSYVAHENDHATLYAVSGKLPAGIRYALERILTCCDSNAAKGYQSEAFNLWMKGDAQKPETLHKDPLVAEIWLLLNNRHSIDRKIIQAFKTADSSLVNFTPEQWYPLVYDCIWFNRVDPLAYLIETYRVKVHEIPDFEQMVLQCARQSTSGVTADMIEELVIQRGVVFQSQDVLAAFIKKNDLKSVVMVHNSNKELIPTVAQANHAFEKGHVEMLQWIVDVAHVCPSGVFRMYINAVHKANGKALAPDWIAREKSVKFLAASGKLKISQATKDLARSLRVACDVILQANEKPDKEEEKKDAFRQISVEPITTFSSEKETTQQPILDSVQEPDMCVEEEDEDELRRKSLSKSLRELLGLTALPQNR